MPYLDSLVKFDLPVSEVLERLLREELSGETSSGLCTRHLHWPVARTHLLHIHQQQHSPNWHSELDASQF
jgi:hypothetical protein